MFGKLIDGVDVLLAPSRINVASPVAQDMDAAGIGGEHAADGGRAFGGEREGEEAARGAGGLLHGSGGSLHSIEPGL
jgi:hypothetical protein